MKRQIYLLITLLISINLLIGCQKAMDATDDIEGPNESQEHQIATTSGIQASDKPLEEASSSSVESTTTSQIDNIIDEIEQASDQLEESITSADELANIEVQGTTEAINQRIYFDIIGPSEVGTILSTELDYKEGMTILDLLIQVTDKHAIALDYTGSKSSSYIRGIDGVYEKDYGPLSGWMYSVNGDFPLKSAGSVIANEEDIVRFLYTKDMGKDIQSKD